MLLVCVRHRYAALLSPPSTPLPRALSNAPAGSSWRAVDEHIVLLTTPTRCAHGLRSVYGHHPTTPKTKKDWSLKYPPEVRTQRARPPPRAAPCEPFIPSVSRMSLISDVNPKESDVFGTFLTQTQREGGRFWRSYMYVRRAPHGLIQGKQEHACDGYDMET